MEEITAAADSISISEYLDAESGTDQNDYFEDFVGEQENQKHSIIFEIREEIEATKNDTIVETTNNSSIHKSESFNSAQCKGSSESLTAKSSLSLHSDNMVEDNSLDYIHDPIWRGQKKHIFILSEAGKPIYSLHGNEDKLAILFGIIQALISFVQHGQDALTSIHAKGIKFVFLVRNSLILVAASRTKMSASQLQMQLCDVYNQVLSTLTYSHVTKIFEKRKNFDLRRLLAGSERLINHLLSNDSSNKRVSNDIFAFFTNSIRVMPIPSTLRSNISIAIQNNCSKIKNLVFAVLIANNKLITLIRMKKYMIHPADLRLLFNLIECSESFKASENWTPICLPKFDMNGYLHAHVSYISDDCQACLLLLSVDRDVFFTLSDAKLRITEKLRRSNILTALSEEINKNNNAELKLSAIGISELRHFLYKPKAISQVLCAELKPPYTSLKEFERLENIYCDLLNRIQNSSCPLKLIYEVKEREVVLAWVTAAYELYAVFEPMVDKSSVIKYVDKLIKWIEKEHDVHFIRIHPTF